MNTELKKLKDLTSQIDDMMTKRINPASEEFKTWHTRAQRILDRIYGEDSKEAKSFRDKHYSSMVFIGGMTDAEMVAADIKVCLRFLQSVRVSFKIYIEELEEGIGDDTDMPVEIDLEKMPDFKKVFIVHGHDGELKEQVARLLEKQEIEPVILHERANRGRTIIEKIEAYADGVDAAICLYTSDDEMSDGSKRARQNVVFETGYFCGKIGRSNTIIIAENETMNLSDLDGIVYVDRNNWEVDLLKELKDIGYRVDLNKL